MVFPCCPLRPGTACAARWSDGLRQKLEETGWRSCQLGSATVARTRQPEETGPGSCQIHQTGEEFLNSEEALEETEMPSTGQAGGTDVVRRRALRGLIGEAFAIALTNTIVYQSAPGHSVGLMAFNRWSVSVLRLSLHRVSRRHRASEHGLREQNFQTGQDHRNYSSKR